MCERNEHGLHPTCIEALLDGPGAEDHGFCGPCADEIRRRWKELEHRSQRLAEIEGPEGKAARLCACGEPEYRHGACASFRLVRRTADGRELDSYNMVKCATPRCQVRIVPTWDDGRARFKCSLCQKNVCGNCGGPVAPPDFRCVSCNADVREKVT